MRELRRAAREHGGAEGEHIDETVISGGAKRRHLSQPTVTCWPGFGETVYIYTIPLYDSFSLPSPPSVPSERHLYDTELLALIHCESPSPRSLRLCLPVHSDNHISRRIIDNASELDARWTDELNMRNHRANG